MTNEQIKTTNDFIHNLQVELLTINNSIEQLYKERTKENLFCDPIDEALEQLEVVQQAVKDASKAIAKIQDAIKKPDQTLVIVRDNGEQRKGKVIGTRMYNNAIEFYVKFPDGETIWFDFARCKAVI